MSRDYSITLDPQGNFVAHRVDCPEVDHLRKLGEPILTMLACEKPLSDECIEHSCLREEK
jgi:hypothetical protein